MLCDFERICLSGFQIVKSIMKLCSPTPIRNEKWYRICHTTNQKNFKIHFLLHQKAIAAFLKENSIRKNVNKKLHKLFFHFSFFLIIPIIWKYIQGMGFHLIITVLDYLTPTHRFSIFEKKVEFSPKNAKSSTLTHFSTFSSHIVKHWKIIIRNF